MTGHRDSRWRTKLLLGIAAACFLLASPCILLGALGLAGMAADVGPQDNHRIGLGFLRLALIPISIGAVASLVALLRHRKK